MLLFIYLARYVSRVTLRYVTLVALLIIYNLPRRQSENTANSLSKYIGKKLGDTNGSLKIHYETQCRIEESTANLAEHINSSQ